MSQLGEEGNTILGRQTAISSQWQHDALREVNLKKDGQSFEPDIAQGSRVQK